MGEARYPWATFLCGRVKTISETRYCRDSWLWAETESDCFLWATSITLRASGVRLDRLKDIPELVRAAKEIGNIALVIVDPIVNVVAGDSNKNAEVRRSLQPVADLAEELAAAVLGISHYTKGTQGK